MCDCTVQQPVYPPHESGDWTESFNRSSVRIFAGVLMRNNYVNFEEYCTVSMRYKDLGWATSTHSGQVSNSVWRRGRWRAMHSQNGWKTQNQCTLSILIIAKFQPVLHTSEALAYWWRGQYIRLIHYVKVAKHQNKGKASNFKTLLVFDVNHTKMTEVDTGNYFDVPVCCRQADCRKISRGLCGASWDKKLIGLINFFSSDTRARAITSPVRRSKSNCTCSHINAPRLCKYSSTTEVFRGLLI